MQGSQQTYQANEQVAAQPDRRQAQPEQRRWRPRQVPGLVAGLGMVGAILAVVSVLWIVFGDQAMESMKEVPAYLQDGTLVAIAIAIAVLCIVIAVAAMVVIYTRPTAFKVRQELIRSLIQLRLLDDDMTMWKGMFSVAPKGRYNRKAQCYSISFMLHNVNAKEQELMDLSQAIAGFARSRDCSIEMHPENRFYNFKLHLWYSRDSYAETLDEINPWR